MRSYRVAGLHGDLRFGERELFLCLLQRRERLRGHKGVSRPSVGGQAQGAHALLVLLLKLDGLLDAVVGVVAALALDVRLELGDGVTQRLGAGAKGAARQPRCIPRRHGGGGPVSSRPRARHPRARRRRARPACGASATWPPPAAAAASSGGSHLRSAAERVSAERAPWSAQGGERRLAQGRPAHSPSASS